MFMNKLDKQSPITCLLNKTDFSFNSPLFTIASRETAAEVARFHQSLPGYHPTPHIALPALADTLGIRNILVKDESHRFDLKAFKVLGASYAMARVLKGKLNLHQEELTFGSLLSKSVALDRITFVTATDGNHGRAVAWMAKKIGCKAVVYMPRGSSETRVSAIRDIGADVSVTDSNYDDTVIYAEKKAQEQNWILLQDTSWPGYETVPVYIMQGYFTLLSEFVSQDQDQWPTHFFIQAGVGSLAASTLAFLCRCVEKPKPVFVVVEPKGAACYYNSVKAGDGKTHRVMGDLQTVMSGLACGQPSLAGWELLKSGVDTFIICADEVAKQGMRLLANPYGTDPPIVSGESGAVTLGLVHNLLMETQYVPIRRQLRLDRDSRVFLISTEGDTDSDSYRRIINE